MDVLSWLENLDGWKPTGKPDEYIANCPMCPRRHKGIDTHRHLSINIVKLVVYCFRCHFGGSAERFAQIMGSQVSSRPRKSMQVHKLGANLGFGAGLDAPVPFDASTGLITRIEPYKSIDFDSIIHKEAVRYLKKRGIGRKQAVQHGLGYATEGKMAGRIIFPVRFKKGICGYIGRTIFDETPKYLFPAGFNYNEFLYNYPNVKRRSSVILVEGVFDALRLDGQAVALFTNKMSAAQKNIIINTWSSVKILLDNDAQENAYKIQRALSNYVKCVVLHLETAKDPSEASDSELRRVLANPRHGLGVLL